MAQVMKLSYFPQIKVVHTSKTFHGQRKSHEKKFMTTSDWFLVYVPLLNWLLMIATVMVAAIYNNTTSLGNAYGFAIPSPGMKYY